MYYHKSYMIICHIVYAIHIYIYAYMYTQCVCICLCIYQTCIYVGKHTTVISIECYHASVYIYRFLCLLYSVVHVIV